MFGRPAGRYAGGGWDQIVLPEDLDRFHAAFLEAFHARAHFRTEARVRDKTGRVIWLCCEGVPRMDDAGRFLGYTGCNVDITEARLAAEELERRVAERTAELMAAEETLRQAQKMEAVGQLTGGIAHDFNNMLQGVTGGLGMARRRVAEGRTARGAAVPRRCAGRGGARGGADAAPARLCASAAIGAEAGGNGRAGRRPGGPAPAHGRPGIAVELRLRDGAGSVLCDPNELESALLNLCINARDAMPEGGRLTIATEDLRLVGRGHRGRHGQPGHYVALAVADTGTGMPPEVLDAGVRAVLHHQAAGPGHRAGSEPGLRLRAAVRRHWCRSRARRGGARRCASSCRCMSMRKRWDDRRRCRRRRTGAAKAGRCFWWTTRTRAAAGSRPAARAGLHGAGGAGRA